MQTCTASVTDLTARRVRRTLRVVFIVTGVLTAVAVAVLGAVAVCMQMRSSRQSRGYPGAAAADGRSVVSYGYPGNGYPGNGYPPPTSGYPGAADAQSVVSGVSYASGYSQQ